MLLETLEQIDGALARVERRFANIGSPDDFLDSDNGQDMLDGIAMMVIAIGKGLSLVVDVACYYDARRRMSGVTNIFVVYNIECCPLADSVLGGGRQPTRS